MSSNNVIQFLQTVASRADLLDSLKIKSKDEVILLASGFGLPFTESEFDSLIWDLEVFLAGKRGEKFGPQFSLWQTMWGKYYLEYLVADVIPSFAEADYVAVMTAKNARRSQ